MTKCIIYLFQKSKAMFKRLRHVGRTLKRELVIYRTMAAHPHTPRLARWCLGLALAYLMLPFDLIPDCIPIVGHLDDLVIVPGLILLALLMIPSQVKKECRTLKFDENTEK